MPIFAILLAIGLFITPAIDASIEAPAPHLPVTRIEDGYVRAAALVSEPAHNDLLPMPVGKVGNGQCIDYVKARLGYAVVEWISAKNFYENYADYQFIKLDRPTETSVVVTSESASWHVAIVESVAADSIVITEQNYIKGTIGTRTLSTSDEKIKGYFIWDKKKLPRI